MIILGMHRRIKMLNANSSRGNFFTIYYPTWCRAVVINRRQFYSYIGYFILALAQIFDCQYCCQILQIEHLNLAHSAMHEHVKMNKINVL